MHWKPSTFRFALATTLLVASTAHAQISLPRLPLPQGTSLPQVEPLGNPTAGLELPATDLRPVRRLAARTLLRTHRRELEADPRGEPIVRGELLAIAPAQAALDQALADGYAVLRRETFDAFGTRLVVLAPPAHMAVARALERLRLRDPAGTYDFNHIYMAGGAVGASEPTGTTPRPPPAALPTPAAPLRVGLIDSGVNDAHPVFHASSIRHWGCKGAVVPDDHGTAVASLLVGDAPGFAGAAARGELYAADVYCGAATGGSVENIADALSWMAREQVPVVNMSLVGPQNVTLAYLVHRAVVAGQLLVAAVGNDGPAAPPLYPAAYPGVVGVTGVDAKRRALPEANRGPQVAFAAPGADMLAAGKSGFAPVRGTSFAAPLVAGLLARWQTSPDADAANRAVEALAAQAIDLGASGRDPVYGRGLVAESLRVARLP